MVSGSIPDKRIGFLQFITVSWMLMECTVSLTASWKSGSISLLAFGADSFVELISAAAVLLQFTPQFQISQTTAARFCGTLLYCLAAVICVIAFAGFFEGLEAETSRLGIAITSGALLVMPILAYLKRNAADRTANRALRADAVQSAACAYLAALTLAGLLFRLAFGLHWLDQMAALAAVPILIVEARRARNGQTCACC